MDGTSRRGMVLLSGGLDSATALAVAVRDGFRTLALSFEYGQRHRVELESAARVAACQGAEHLVVSLDPAPFAASALTGGGAVPKDRTDDEIAGGIPETYVPARNLVFLSMAVGIAESRGIRDIFLGVNAVDYSGYPDCRPEFISAFEETANLATKSGISGEHARIHTPLMHLSKAGIIRAGLGLGVDYSMTSSCYDPDAAGLACGRCDSCVLRRRGFLEAGSPDPTRYVPGAPV